MTQEEAYVAALEKPGPTVRWSVDVASNGAGDLGMGWRSDAYNPGARAKALQCHWKQVFASAPTRSPRPLARVEWGKYTKLRTRG